MISVPLIKHIWRDLRHREIRLLLVSVIFLQSIGGSAATLCYGGEDSLRLLQGLIKSVPMTPLYWVCIWGAGVIGIKTSRGTLALVFSRPLTTSTLVVSSWVAIASAAFATHLLLVALTCIQVLVIMPSCFDFVSIGAQIVRALLVCLGASAVLVFFSTLLTGVKDLGLFFLVFVISQVMQSARGIPARMIKQSFLRQLCQGSIEVVSSFGDALSFCIRPEIPLTASVLFSWNLVLSLVAITAVILCSLSLAILRLNKMELSYAAD